MFWGNGNPLGSHLCHVANQGLMEDYFIGGQGEGRKEGGSGK